MDDAERAHQLLTIAAEVPGPPVDAPGPALLRRARARRRQRHQFALASVTLTVLAVAVPLGLFRSAAWPLPLAPAHGRGSPAPGAAPAQLPRAFGAAAPTTGRGGPLTTTQRDCRRGDVRGSAEMRRGPDGTLGVVRLRGNRCSLGIDTASITLLDRAGRPLGVPVRAEPNLNPGSVFRPDIAAAQGVVAVGFAWRGSWCGVPAAQLRLVALGRSARPRTLFVPVTGSSPRCEGRSTGYVVPGLVGRPDQPVQTAPPAWAALHAVLELPATARGDRSIGYRVLLQNRGTRPVTLSPCPDYSVLVSGAVLASGHVAAGWVVAEHQGTLPCAHVLPPAGSLAVPLRIDGYRDGPYAPGRLQVQWSMAGVPIAAGMVNIR